MIRHRGEGESGVVSLELALAIPLLFLLLLVVFHAATLGRDALLVQDAARQGARVAATTADRSDVVAAVTEAVDGRQVTVSISGARRPGGLVTVAVTMASKAGRGGTTVTGEAAAAVEPGTES